jgi:hypothetical protein
MPRSLASGLDPRILIPLVPLVLAAIAGTASPAPIEINGYRFDPSIAGPRIPTSLQAPESRGRATYLIQFGGPVEEGWKDALRDLGVSFHGYVPEGAFIVRMDDAAAARVRSLDFVRYVGPYHIAYRISPEIGRTQLRTPERRDDPLVTLRVRVAEEPATIAITAARIGEILELIVDPGQPGFVIHCDPASVVELAAIPTVLWVEERPETFLLNNVTKWVVQSNASGIAPIWDKGIYGEGQLICQMDSGLDYNSCWFRDVGSVPPGPTHRKVVDYRAWGGSAYDKCDTGHGTHVAGTIVGDQSFINPGDYNYNGMAYKAKIMMQDVGSDDFISCLFGFISVPASLTDPFDDAYAKGASMHTNSWGSSSNAYDSYCVDVDTFMWNHKEFLILFANGNSGPNPSTVASPATAKDCVSVGATQQAPGQETIASYSSRGPAGDSRWKPTVTAPGGEAPTYINSANNNTGNPPSPTCATQGSPFQGTSMATPAVAGCGLLIRDYFAQGFYPLGTGGGDPILPSAALLKAMLTNSGRDMGTADQPNNNEGWGRILLDDVLYFEGDTRETRIEEESVGLATGEEIIYTYDVDSSTEPLEITLVWTDYPAVAGANPTLVNNLDLTVTAPDAQVYKGNVYGAGQSVTGGSSDARNVEECVRRVSPATGPWMISIRGANVPQGGRQPYALVTTGSFGAWPEPPAAAGEGPSLARLVLDPARPNPFSDETAISFRTPAEGHVRLTIHDAGGRTITSLADAILPAGEHHIVWDGRTADGGRIGSGIFFYRLEAAGLSITRKLTRVR